MLATTSCLVIIKVFRLNGRPYCFSSVSFSLLLRSSVSNRRSYCYSSVSFSLLLLLRYSVSNGRPYCFGNVSFLLLLFFFSYRFRPKNFSNMLRQVLEIKIKDLLNYTHFVINHRTRTVDHNNVYLYIIYFRSYVT